MHEFDICIYIYTIGTYVYRKYICIINKQYVLVLRTICIVLFLNIHIQNDWLLMSHIEGSISV